jgi:hypothetical protein
VRNDQHRAPEPENRPAAWRRRAAGALTAAAAVLVFVALVLPDQLGRYWAEAWVPGAFLRLPIEGIAGAAVLLALPKRPRRVAAVLLGLGLGVLTVQKLLNIGFLAVLGRRFDLVVDWPLLGDGLNALTATYGRPATIGAAVAATVAAVALPAALTLAVLRLATFARCHDRAARRVVTAGVAVWVVFALLGTQLFPDAPIASDTSAAMAKRTIVKVPASLRDRTQFANAMRTDAFAGTPPADLLRGLRGSDVVFGVVESYGRSALTDPQMAAVVGPALDAGARRLAAAGFGTRSGFLTSSTYGGGSWLAHASVQSGLWIDNQQRYRQLVSGDRLTLAGAFHRAGWRTIGVEPGNTKYWPEGDFYGYDQVYDSRTLGYRGPSFAWSPMPDQYTLAAFQQSVYGVPARGPLMAEITLTSSHEPWTRIPRLIDWSAVGDGSIYRSVTPPGAKRSSLWAHPARVKAQYAASVTYSIASLVDWAVRYGGRHLVLVIYGDHQALPIVSGTSASHDIPITIVANDPAVLDRIAGWGWQPGLRPGPRAPVWRMDSFRDRFLTAFGS